MGASGNGVSVFYSEDRAFFGFGVTPVVDPCRCNGTMTKHFLNFLYVCLVIERIGGGGRAKRMRPDAEIAMRETIDRGRIERPASGIILEWPEERPCGMPCFFEVLLDEALGFGLDGHIANFRALPVDFEVKRPAALLSVLDG